jgi:outer membrane protein OmpA-like peptidoglycan-associated protein
MVCFGKKSLMLLLTLGVFSFAFGQEKKTLSAGLLVEANANTRHGYGLAGGLIADFGLTDALALGVKVDYGTDFYDVSSFEALGFGRYYFLKTPLPFPLFVQAGAGLIILFEGDRRVFSVLGDGSLGIRFPIKKFYTEQYLRFGWPTGFGFGLVIGYRFGSGKSPPPPVYVPPQEQEPEFLAQITNMEVIFPPNLADFDAQGAEYQAIREHNFYVLDSLARFLKDNPGYTLYIVGRANPVIRTDTEESDVLQPLSRRRADYVRNKLMELGVEGGRLVTLGEGGAGAFSDNAARNRRVHFRAEKTSGP